MKKEELSWWNIANHLSRGYRLDSLHESKKNSIEGVDANIGHNSEYWGEMSAYIGLGSNLGDRENNLLDAIELIKPYHHTCSYERHTADDEFLRKTKPDLMRNLKVCKDANLEQIQISSFYETDPIDCQDTSKYLNAVIKIQTRLDPQFLLETLQRIEFNMGRERPYLNAPRVIDLDLLCYAGGSWVVQSDSLTLPHPRMYDRAFVIVPLAEIEPNLFIRDDPGSGWWVSERLKEVSTTGVRKWIK